MKKYAEHILNTSIEYLKGVGPKRTELLIKEQNIGVFGDLLYHFPFRYIDRTKFHKIDDPVSDGDSIQLKLQIKSITKIKTKGKTRLSVKAYDGKSLIELIWFRNVKWFENQLVKNQVYIVFGKINIFNGKKSLVHPEMELAIDAINKLGSFDPVYSSTERLTSANITSRLKRNTIRILLGKIKERDIIETLPDYIISKLKLISRYNALRWIHFPEDINQRDRASNRLKFEELFYLQLRLLYNKSQLKLKVKGLIFENVGDNFNHFYNKKLSFELTNAQKRVIKEIRNDTHTGAQMNRLLQGDVGSGKTVVAIMTMLLAIDNGFQACLLAPTEILARQHLASIADSLNDMDITVDFLSGQVKGKKRKELLEKLNEGKIDILIGTHAILEDPVIFNNLGLAITDEQHRFGVKQRSKLWHKNKNNPPHILVMTATPIPRTLAMTTYGDLDISIIDELPPGRKSIKTVHKYDNARAQIISFMHKQIKDKKQIYIVYPLIEESSKLDLQNLEEGYERLLQFFPLPDYQIAVVHGKMKPKDKDMEMARFASGKAQILVATTVIEVGVNVPNATTIIIENTERFGLAQLHQLRGRVGRGGDQSYCILMTSYKLSKESKERIATMVRTTDGFEIAEADLRLRGAGDIQGTQQSGIMDLKIANLVKDIKILQVARHIASDILKEDPYLKTKKNKLLAHRLTYMKDQRKSWGRIS